MTPAQILAWTRIIRILFEGISSIFDSAGQDPTPAELAEEKARFEAAHARLMAKIAEIETDAT